MEIVDKVIPDQKLAVINYKGPIVDMDVLIAKLMGWVEAENVKTDGDPFIIYYSPRSSIDEEETVYDIGVPIEGDPDGTDLIKIVDMLEHNVLSGRHEGNQDNILKSYEKMVDMAQKNNFDIIGSPKEVLIKSRYDVDSDDELITEIQLPIIKM
ncbi:GyrI-like domain-containing protein [Methanobrevibacter sp. OttesenSCG-928-K11]|nr:GyrI-like domain-containing protein [Methanobrevibacter sp. OttesenSCG-928-K11]